MYQRYVSPPAQIRQVSCLMSGLSEAELQAEIKGAMRQARSEADGAAERVAYLRERGVEIQLPGERSEPLQIADGPPFKYVYVPADSHAAVRELNTPRGIGDILPALLAPRFDDNMRMDDDIVARETASRVKNMRVGGSMELNGKTIATPSAAAIQREAAGGKCESYPLMQPSEENGWRGVRMYIDEVGALRARPRNVRAEELANAAGLAGLAIHGDAYVGRHGGAVGSAVGGHNLDFALKEMAHNSEWVAQARAANLRQAAQAGLCDTEHLPSGGDEAGPYSWSQTDDDVEVIRNTTKP